MQNEKREEPTLTDNELARSQSRALVHHHKFKIAQQTKTGPSGVVEHRGSAALSIDCWSTIRQAARPTKLLGRKTFKNISPVGNLPPLLSQPWLVSINRTIYQHTDGISRRSFTRPPLGRPLETKTKKQISSERVRIKMKINTLHTRTITNKEMETRKKSDQSKLGRNILFLLSGSCPSRQERDGRGSPLGRCQQGRHHRLHRLFGGSELRPEKRTIGPRQPYIYS